MFHVKHFIQQILRRQDSIFFPHWLWTVPQLFPFVRLRLPRHEQFSSQSIPKSNSKIVMLPPSFELYLQSSISIICFYQTLWRCIFRFNESYMHFDILISKTFFRALQAKIQSQFCSEFLFYLINYFQCGKIFLEFIIRHFISREIFFCNIYDFKKIFKKN